MQPFWPSESSRFGRDTTTLHMVAEGGSRARVTPPA